MAKHQLGSICAQHDYRHVHRKREQQRRGVDLLQRRPDAIRMADPDDDGREGQPDNGGDDAGWAEGSLARRGLVG